VVQFCYGALYLTNIKSLYAEPPKIHTSIFTCVIDHTRYPLILALESAGYTTIYRSEFTLQPPGDMYDRYKITALCRPAYLRTVIRGSFLLQSTGT